MGVCLQRTKNKELYKEIIVSTYEVIDACITIYMLINVVIPVVARYVRAKLSQSFINRAFTGKQFL